MSSLSNPTRAATIGGYGTAYSFKGKIDSVRVYRRALSASEVANHYLEEASSLVARWLMDEGAGSQSQDSSGQVNHGNLQGPAWSSGWYGSGLSFDGSDDYVDAGNSASLDVPDATTNVPVEM